MDLDDEDYAPGWDAIDSALQRLVSTEQPLHYANMPALPDQGGIYGLHAYRLGQRWLLITLGLSELFDKGSDDLKISGWGIELTMLVDGDTEPSPPKWALRVLEELGAYVYSSARPFASGHRMHTPGPITGGQTGRISCLAFVLDPLLGGIETVNGHVDFLRVVGITADELAAAQATSTDAMLASLGISDLLTDPTR